MEKLDEKIVGEISLPLPLRTSKDLTYVLQKERELEAFSKKVGEECVIVPLSYAMSVDRYVVMRKRDAENDEIRTGPYPRPSVCYDKSWFQRKKERLRTKSWTTREGEVVYA